VAGADEGGVIAEVVVGGADEVVAGGADVGVSLTVADEVAASAWL
jgi:hypothetical protein